MALGIVIFAAQRIGGSPRSGMRLVSLAIMTAFGAVILLGGPQRDDPRPARRVATSASARSTSTTLRSPACWLSRDDQPVITEVAGTHDGAPYELVEAIAGRSCLIAGRGAEGLSARASMNHVRLPASVELSAILDLYPGAGAALSSIGLARAVRKRLEHDFDRGPLPCCSGIDSQLAKLVFNPAQPLHDTTGVDSGADCGSRQPHCSLAERPALEQAHTRESSARSQPGPSDRSCGEADYGRTGDGDRHLRLARLPRDRARQ
jgi:hypothetical protein